MATSTIYEIIGYIASLLVAVSLMMSSILRLRIINLIGAIFFTAYGLLIHAYPVAAVNFFIVLIDSYYLYQMFSAKEFFRLLEVRPDSEYLHFFLNFYAGDIRRSQPGFTYNASANPLIFFVLRNLVPAGLVIGELQASGNLHIRLDYAIPGYRDLKTGRFVYKDQAAVLRSRGIQQISADPGEAVHARYLRQMGFEPQASAVGNEIYCLKV
jgi:hypothetical protein